MRLRELVIENHNQFEYLKLDLTYPEGHINAGSL